LHFKPSRWAIFTCGVDMGHSRTGEVSHNIYCLLSSSSCLCARLWYHWRSENLYMNSLSNCCF
jgi:hypothetical protein